LRRPPFDGKDYLVHVRHGLATALVTLLGLALAAPASAGVNAIFSGGSLEVGMTASGDSARVFVDGTNIRVAEDPTITGGTPTLTTTSTIRFEDFSGGGDTTAVIDHSGGPFEPGPDDESGDTDEIEFAFDMQAGNDVVQVILLPTGQEVAVGNTGINFNPLEDEPPAKDDDVLGDLAAVESVVVQGGPGDDTITGSSIGAGVDTATKPLTITGGGGDDDLTGGNGPDIINSQDGDNNDVISCRDGADSATADFFDAVGTDCETITRPPSGGGGPGGGGPGTGTPSGTAQVSVPSGSLRAHRGRIGVRVRCVSSPTGTCRGSVSLRKRIRGRVRTLGSARYAVAVGRVVRVVVRLNRLGRALLRARRSFKVTLRVVIDGRTISRTITIRR
jgi:hypothetical protein